MATTYADLSAANPYKGQVRKDGILQQMWKAFGGRTSTDAWNENMAVQAAEYDAQMKQMQFMNEYNSPAAEVQRMREAGLNPDLQGIGDVAEAATPPDDPSTPMQSEGDGPLVQQVTGMVFNVFNTALGLAQGIQGMYSSFLANTGKSLENDSRVQDLANKMWKNFLPPSPDPSAENGNGLNLNNFDWKSKALKSAEAFANRNFSKRYRKKFIDSVQNYWESGPGQYESYSAWSNRVKARKDFYMERDTFYSDIDDVLNDMISPLAEKMMQITTQKQETDLAGLQADQNKAEYDKELYGENGLDPMAEAGATNSQRGLSETNNTMVKDLNDSIGEIIGNLKKTADNEHGLKGALANIALVLMASVRLWLANSSAPLISSRSTNNYRQYTTNNNLGFD